MTTETIIIEEARVGMHARILRCPLGDNPTDCPLYEVRKWPMEKRLAWLDAMTDEETIDLFHRHTDCQKHKMEKRPA